MKTADLRNTVLIVTGILLATFLLSAWWVSRQATALKEISESLRETRKVYAETKAELTKEQVKLENTRDEVERMSELRDTFPLPLMHRARRGFNDIQTHVAQGEFKGLALTEGYIELKRIFDNPAFEEMLEKDHVSQRPSE